MSVGRLALLGKIRLHFCASRCIQRSRHHGRHSFTFEGKPEDGKTCDTHTLVVSHVSSLLKISHHNCVTAVMCSELDGSSVSSNSCCNRCEGESQNPSRYLFTIWYISCGWTYSVPHLNASGLWRSFCLNDRHSTVFLSPPGVCLWSPAQMLIQVRGVRAMTDVFFFPPTAWSKARETIKPGPHRSRASRSTY